VHAAAGVKIHKRESERPGANIYERKRLKFVLAEKVN
jgi:hypothetical protein